MDKPESIFSFLAALLTAIGSFLGLLRISPDWFPAFGKSSISSINSKFEETTKLESNLEGRGESAIRLRKKGLADEALETLSYKIYMRDGIRFISNRGKVGCGCISCCLIGFEIGIAAVLLLLSCAFSQEEDEDTASRYFIAFIVVILVILMTVKACCWIYARIALNRQFRLYMWNRWHDGEDGAGDSLQMMMEKSHGCLLAYEKKRGKYKAAVTVLWVMLVVFPLTSAFVEDLKPLADTVVVKFLIKTFNLTWKDIPNILSTAAVWVCVGCPYLLLFIAGMVLHLSDKENEEAKANPAKQRPDDVDFNAGDVESQTQSESSRQSQAGGGKHDCNPDKAQSFPDVRAPEIEPAEKPIAAASKVESLQTCSMVLIIVVAAAFILGIRNRRG